MKIEQIIENYINFFDEPKRITYNITGSNIINLPKIKKSGNLAKNIKHLINNFLDFIKNDNVNLNQTNLDEYFQNLLKSNLYSKFIDFKIQYPNYDKNIRLFCNWRSDNSQVQIYLSYMVDFLILTILENSKKFIKQNELSFFEIYLGIINNDDLIALPFFYCDKEEKNRLCLLLHS